MEVPQTLKKAIGRLKDEAQGHSRCAELAREVLPLLEATATSLSGVVRESRRGTGTIEYLVERTQQGEVLTERRLSGNSQPYRCSKAIYEAVAEVLAAADRPLLLDEIVAGAEQRLGSRPSDFHVRLALRLWMTIDPLPIARARARYSVIEAAAFVTTTRQMWIALRK